MRVVVNGWFVGEMATGTGQYLAALKAWLPAVGAGHEWVVVERELSRGDAARKRQTSPKGMLDEHVEDEERVAEWRVVYAGTAVEWAGENVAKVWWEQVTFPRVCRRLDADVAFVPYWGSPWWRPCSVVVTIHDLIPLLLPAYRGNPQQRAYTWLVGRTARRAQGILTDSEASRQDIVGQLRVAQDRVHVAHLAANHRLSPVRDRAELERVREQYRLPAGPFWLYLGGFDARKNVSRLLAAYARLRNAGCSGVIPPLVIAGKLPSVDSAFTPDPRPIAAGLRLGNTVQFTGWVDEADKPSLYSLASAAFFLSEYEGFGLPVLEAQACGCPVVVSG